MVSAVSPDCVIRMVRSSRPDQRIAIAKLAGVIHFHRKLGQSLDHELARQPGVPTGAAGRDIDLLQLAEIVVGDVHLVEEHLARVERDAAQRGIADGARLLVDFLQHEMLEAALLRHDGVPGDVLHLAGDGLAFEVGELHARRRNDGKIAIGEKEQVASVVQNGRHVAGDEVFVFAQADDRGRPVAGGDNLVGLVCGDDGDGEHSGQQLHRLADGFFQRDLAVGRGEIFLDQVGDHFGVGLGAELVAFVDQLLLQRDVVLYDAVVHDHDLAGAIAVGMRILFRGTAMGGPASVADAVSAVERLQADDLFQVAQLALGAAHLQASAVAGHGDAGRVVAAIFEAPQAVNDDRHNPLFPDVSNNPAHSCQFACSQLSVNLSRFDEAEGVPDARGPYPSIVKRYSSMTGLVSTSRAMRSTSACAASRVTLLSSAISKYLP